MERSDSTMQQITLLNLAKPNLDFVKSYLSAVRNVKYRQAVTRFRISAHRFPVEAGRYANDYKLRIFPICDSNDIGDEFSSLGKNDLLLYCISMKEFNKLCSQRYLQLTKIFSDCTICN
jgi:hypothetical protein